MISNTLREFIEPNLKMHLQRRDWKYIDEMFSECYLTNPAGEDIITLKPHPEGGSLAPQFTALTGSFYEITDWDYIKSIGTLL